jgi:hypothetical protein
MERSHTRRDASEPCEPGGELGCVAPGVAVIRLCSIEDAHVATRCGSRAQRLGRPDRRSHRAELRRLAAGVLERGACVGVDELALLDVGVSPLDQQARVLAREQRPGNSASPPVDALARVLGNVVLDDDVGDPQAAVRFRPARWPGWIHVAQLPSRASAAGVDHSRAQLGLPAWIARASPLLARERLGPRCRSGRLAAGAESRARR